MLLPLCVNAQPQTDFFLQAERVKWKLEKSLSVYVKGKDVEDIYAFELDVIFDSNKLELIKTAGTNEGYSHYNLLDKDKVHFVFTKIGDTSSLKGDEDLLKFTFKMLEASEASIELESMRIVSSEIIDTKVGDLESLDTKYSFDDKKISVTGVLKSEEKEPSSPGSSGGTNVSSGGIKTRIKEDRDEK